MGGGGDSGRGLEVLEVLGRRFSTDFSMPLHSENLDTLDDGGAGVVYALEHRLQVGSGYGQQNFSKGIPGDLRGLALAFS